MTTEEHKIVISADDSAAQKAFANIRAGAAEVRKSLDGIAAGTQQVSSGVRNLANIDAFARLKDGAAAAKNEFAAAQARVADLARQLRNAGTSSTTLVGDFNAAKNAARAAKAAYQEKTVALHQMRAAMQAAGISTTDLAAKHALLRRETLLAANNADLLARRQAFYAFSRTGARQLREEVRGLGGASVVAADGTNKLADSFKRLAGTVLVLTAIRVGIDALRGAVAIADEWTLIAGRIRNATESQADFAAAHKGLLAIAKETRSEFGATAQLFVRTNQFIRANGGTQQDTLALVRLVGQAAQVSGASVQEQSSAVRQLSQALASGVLRGDEFNSIMENAPRLAQALADGIGVPVGALREMAEQGQLTADIVTRALLGQADKIAEEFAQIPLTMGGAFTNLKTSFGELVDEFNRTSDLSKSVAEGINGIAQNLPAIAETAKQLVALALPVYFARWAVAIDLAAVAMKRFILPVAAIAGAAKVLELVTAINAERLRARDLEKQQASDSALLSAQSKYLKLQALSLEEFNKLDKASQEFYRKDLALALETARLKLKLNAGKNEQEALEAARLQRLFAQSAREIAATDGNRAAAMKAHSETVIKAKQLEQQRLEAVFQAQKQGLAAAEKAFEDARKKRESILKEFQDLQKELAGGTETGKPILGYEVQNAVEEARRAQELAATAPASQADALAEAALEKARAAGELLKQYKAQQLATGSSIDAAEAQRVVDQLGQQLLDIADKASATQEKVAEDQLAVMQNLIQDTLNQAEALKNLEIGFDEAGAANDLDSLIQALRTKAQNSPINIPVITASGSLPANIPGYEEPQKNATGGLIRGPGTGTSDSILSWLSNGEYVIRAAAVKKIGRGMLDRINAGIIPGFRNGGMLDRVRVPSLSASTSVGAGDTINITLPGLGTYKMQAERNESRRLQRDLSLAVLKHGGPA